MRARGNKLPHAKLTPANVRWIRRNRHGFTCRLQAALLGVHPNTVARARTGENWGWLE